MIHTSLPENPHNHDNVTVLSDTHNSSAVRGPSKSDINYGAKFAKDLRTLVESCQRHKHTRTCYKYDSKECRFGLDEKNNVPETYMNLETGELTYRITDGMINAYTPVVLRAIRCNMDVKFIGSGASAKAILYYITDYITKTMLKAHIAYVALKSARDRMQNNPTIPSNSILTGKSVVVKCANALISKQELSGPQVASFLLGNGDYYTNVKFRSLFWPTLESYIDNESGRTLGVIVDENTEDRDELENGDQARGNCEVDNENTDMPTWDNPEKSAEVDMVGVENDDNGTVVSTGNQLMDYLFRSEDFAKISYWDFVARVDKISKSSDRIKETTAFYDENPFQAEQYHHNTHLVDSNPPASYNVKGRKPNKRAHLLEPHPQSKSHILKHRERSHWLIPVPTGPRIYRRDRPTDYEKYSRLMLLLFKPWRSPSDLLDSFNCYADSFKDFSKKHLPDDKKRIIENIQILHECKDSRDDHFAKRKLRIRGLTDELTAKVSSAADAQTTAIDNLDEIDDLELIQSLEFGDMVKSTSILREENAASGAVQSMVDAGIYSCSDEYNISTDVLDVNIEDNDTHGNSAQDVESTQTLPSMESTWRKYYEKERDTWIKTLNIYANTPTQSAIANPNIQSVSKLANGRNSTPAKMSVTNALNSAKEKSRRQHQSDIICKMTLNYEQEVAFRIVSDHSLGNSIDEPIRFYLGGRGGTGKSRVIESLRRWFRDLGQEYRFRVCAYTGAAAKNVEGMTIHSALRMGNSKRR